MDDLVKYFDVTINEAANSLNVGLTALKRKCRELGIPRWPHRKIKSLGTLIHNLQEEAERQEQVSKAAALAVVRRQRMLESEKEYIEKKPFVQLQTETKRFRQDIFKRRHIIKAKNNTVKKTRKRRKRKSINNITNISHQNTSTTNNNNNSNNTEDNSSNNSNSTRWANDNNINNSTTTATNNNTNTTTSNKSRSSSSSTDSTKTTYYQFIPSATSVGI